MVARSQNGFSANDRSCIASYSLPGGGKVALRKGDVSVVLLWVARRFHDTVEPLVWPGNWGYAERTIRGSSTTLSNHASGTAVDLNAPQHPLGRRGTFSADQVRAIRNILEHCEGVIRWGGDYRSRADEMHFEINSGAAEVRRIADRIRNPPAPPKPAPPRAREDEVMYIKTQPDKGNPDLIWTALLSGPMFVGLGPTEAPSDEQIRGMGAVVQWVEPHTWMDLDRRSRSLCADPRPVINVNSPAA